MFIRGTTQFRADARNFVYFIFFHQQLALTHLWTSQHRHFL
ncbi:hypothetical protein SCRDD08_00712 [Streptococcus cristatus]|uniref:Uncharacterized protein n=1 Tax=Streptococcus cristatus TaxID=45634 RepID=A0A139N3C7_STRCR|nr:hypothetical protein SCRDD08_00712 [Streptococcus cristatus]